MNEERRKGFELKGWHVIVGLLAVLVVLFILFRVFSHSALERKIEELRAKGYPTSFEELEKYNQLPEGTPNAAEIYLKAFAAHQQMTTDEFTALPYGGTGKLPEAAAPFTPAMKAAMESYLTRNHNTLDLLHQAVQIGECQYPVETSTAKGERLNKTKITAHLLCQAAMWECSVENRHPAEKIIDLLGLGSSLHRDAGLNDHLVKMAVLSLSAGLLRDVLSRVQIPLENLNKLDQAFREAKSSQNMDPAFAGEICTVIEAYHNPNQSWQVNVPGGSVMRMTGMMDQNFLIALGYLTDCIDASKLPLTQRFNKCKMIGQKMGNLSFLFSPLGRFLSPLNNLAEFDARMEISHDEALTALAVERFRLAEGRLPESLEELVPKYIEAVPIDPFDGKPLRYKRLEKGYTIYSIGEDGEDNGGVPKDKVEKGANFDWPFTVNR
jgi:hypothetical protein